MLKPAWSAARQPGRWRGRLLVVLLVLLGHGLLLGGLVGVRAASAGAGRPERPQPLTTRLFVPADGAAAPDRAAMADGAVKVAAPLPVSRVLAPAAKRTAPDPLPSAGPEALPAPQAAIEPEEAQETAAVEGRDEAVLLASVSAVRPAAPPAAPVPARGEGPDGIDAAGAPGASAGPTGAAPEERVEPVPVYPTRLPPAFTLSYELRRGPLSGSGELIWQPGPPYALKLEGRVPLLGPVITQTSQGGRDPHGLAPLRFTDRRIRRGEQAANFQRESGRISFSGPPVTYALQPGAQDRLSWMVQIAAIAEAAPRQLPAGKISIFVVGARGDADVWTFRPAGRETLTVGGQALPTVQLLREPRRPHDTRVEVWLAPDAHHLPVRARLVDSSGEAFELMLRTLPDHLRQ